MSQANGAENQPQSYSASSNDFGGAGLLQMPSARFFNDGEVNVGSSNIRPYWRYFGTLQALPWLEGTFRYTSIYTLPYNVHYPDSVFKDRSIDLKVRLVPESAETPQIAIGLRDLGGTGVFSSEYIVSSRRYYNWDFTLGTAWGNAGSRGGLPNPFGLFSDGFNHRVQSQGVGAVNTNFFRGKEVSLFGGIEYSGPIEGMRIKVEYDGNSYQKELSGALTVNSPVNVGVQYAPWDWLDMAFAVERGNDVMLRTTLRTNFNTSKGIPQTDNPPPPLAVRPEGAAAAAAQRRDRVKTEDAAWTSAQHNEMVADNVYDVIEASGVPAQDVEMHDETLSATIAVGSKGGQRGNIRTLAWMLLKNGVQGTINTVVFRATRNGVTVGSASYDQATFLRSMQLSGDPYALLPDTDSAWDEIITADVSDASPAVTPPLALTPAAAKPAAKAPSPVRPAQPEARAPAAPAEKTYDPAIVTAIADKLFPDLEKANFTGEALEMEGTTGHLYLSQRKYRNPSKALGRAAVILANHMPPEIERLSLTLMEIGLPVAEISVLRKDMENLAEYKGSAEEIWQNAEIEPGTLPDDDKAVHNEEAYPRFTWALDPLLRQHVGGGDNFYLYQLIAKLQGDVRLTPRLSMSGGLAANLTNNFEEMNKGQSDSVLPHVRSDVVQYLNGSSRYIDYLTMDYVTPLAPDWYGRLSAGLFEEMFGGVGGEILYRPQGQRWAVGLDLNRVKQRDYQRLFGFRNYEVTTGHLSTYYKLPFYDLQAAVRIGQYLAGDKGATVELSRTFENGVNVGIFATKTNVSADQFGEGSFDKGFAISIPLELFSGAPTRSRAGFAFRPLTRDGGQRVGVSRPLYPNTEGGKIDSIDRGWDEFMR